MTLKGCQKSLLLIASSALLFSCSNGTSFGVGEQNQAFDSSIKMNNQVDIIWVVDDSSSMQVHQQALASQIGSMVDKLNSLKMDYRMVITTTSVGNGFKGGTYVGSPAILSNSTSDLASVLQSRLVVGEGGSDLEQGIQSLDNLLSSDYIAGDGQGFHRDQALLLINILSDEDDQSPGTNASAEQTLENRLNALKKPFRPNVGGWLVNFIGRIDTSCPNQFGDSPIGTRYMDLATASGGNSYSICGTSLANAVSGLQARVLEIITDYPLASEPDLSTVKVYQNDVLVPRSTTNGWDYIPSLKVIRFYGTYVPSTDVKVVVDYTPASAS
jgi:hypothetical protein